MVEQGQRQQKGELIKGTAWLSRASDNGKVSFIKWCSVASIFTPDISEIAYKNVLYCGRCLNKLLDLFEIQYIRKRSSIYCGILKPFIKINPIMFWSLLYHCTFQFYLHRFESKCQELLLKETVCHEIFYFCFFYDSKLCGTLDSYVEVFACGKHLHCWVKYNAVICLRFFL